MRKAVIALVATLILVGVCAFGLTACVDIRDEGDGVYSNQGVLYRYNGQFATVIGAVEGARYCKILPRLENEELGLDAEVTMIEEGAFAGAKIDQVEFDTGFKNLTIYPNAFAGSSVSNLEDFPYTGVTLMDNALAGMGNLKELSVRGDSREAGYYYIGESDNGLYGVGKDGKITLYLVPAARRSADTYTITADIVAPGAFSNNKSISTVNVGNSVSRICKGAFAGVRVLNVSLVEASAEIFVEDGAFEVDKDMRFYVSAKNSVEVLNHWIKLSDGEQLEMLSGLIHPDTCTMTQPHVHGLSAENAPATSLEGIPYEVTDASHYRIKIGETEYTLEYLFTAFSAE